MTGAKTTMSDGAVLRIHVLIAAAAAVADQVSKWIVLSKLDPFQSIEVLGFFNLYLVFNRGAAFGFLAESSWDSNTIFLFATFAILILLFYTLWAMRPGRNQAATGIWLLVAGAIGNLTDRLVHGHVVDFLDFHHRGWHYSTFNLADTWITIGAILIMLDMLNIRILFRKN